VSVRQGGDNRETQSGALARPGFVSPVEAVEKTTGLIWRKAWTFVSHG
jgi:hypothetical protein